MDSEDDVSGTGFAARLYGGFDLNRFFGLELGWTYLPTADDSYGNSITNYAIDLLAKLSIPVTAGFSLHAKAGGSYLSQQAQQQIPTISESLPQALHILDRSLVLAQPMKLYLI